MPPALFIRCQRWADSLAIGLASIGAVLIALMAVHVAIDVSSRYLANFPLPGTVEIVAHYYMVAVIFMPIAYVQLHDRHFRAEIFTQRLSGQTLELLHGCIDLVSAGLLLFLTWRTGSYALAFTTSREFVQTAYFPIPTWPARWLMPTGLGLTAVVALTHGMRSLTRRAP